MDAPAQRQAGDDGARGEMNDRLGIVDPVLGGGLGQADEFFGLYDGGVAGRAADGGRSPGVARIEGAGDAPGADQGLDLLAEQLRSPLVGIGVSVAQKNLGRAVAEQVSTECSSSRLLSIAGRFCVAMMLAWLEPRERSKKSASLVSFSVVRKTWNSSQKKKLGRGLLVRINTCRPYSTLSRVPTVCAIIRRLAMGKCT